MRNDATLTHPYFDESVINRNDYIKVGDLIDCLTEVAVAEETAFHISSLIEWAIGKRAISEFEIYPLQFNFSIPFDKIGLLEKYIVGIPLDKNADNYDVTFEGKPIAAKPIEIRDGE